MPRRAFTRRLYSHLAEFSHLKQHHHFRITPEIFKDLAIWQEFLMHPSVCARDFADFSKTLLADEIEFYMDTSKNFELGFGGYCEKSWMYGIWGPVVADLDPSIQYLELYAQTAGILAWINRFKNRRVVIFCNNQSVVHMINNTSSSCSNCMVLIRIIVLYSLIYNVRIFAKYV